MDDTLSTTAYRSSVLGLWGSMKTGQLTLSKGVLTLEIERHGTRDPLFSVPVDEVRARFPRLLYFGMGLQLITRGKKHRIWFVRTTPDQGGYSFNVKDVRPARAATQTWRTALSGTGT